MKAIYKKNTLGKYAINFLGKKALRKRASAASDSSPASSARATSAKRKGRKSPFSFSL